MRKSYSKIILIGIAVGAAAGSLLGALGLLGVVSGESLMAVSRTIIRVGTGIIVLLIDFLCVWALLRPLVIDHIEKHGKAVTGRIEEVTVIRRPDLPDGNDWTQPVRFACTISYRTEEKLYNKEFSPTCPVSRRELYPQIMENGQSIPVRYCEKYPMFSVIDIGILKTGQKNEQRKSAVYFIAVPTALTGLYVAALMIF